MSYRFSAVVAALAAAVSAACATPAACAELPMLVSAVNPTYTGIYLYVGQTVTGIATGWATWGDFGGPGPVVTPDGIVKQTAGAGYPAPECAPYSLIGSIEYAGAFSPWFCLGRKISYTAQTEGELVLWFNDNNTADNHGAWSAVFTPAH